MWYVWKEICVQRNLKERDHLKDLGLDGWITLKLILNKSLTRAWT